MSGKRSASDLFVYMNGIKVGTLTKCPSGQLRFSYDSDWLANEQTRPISLSLPLRERPFEGDIVYNYFDNLLPDNEPLRARIQKRFNAGSTTCFDLLSHIGADCIGALQLLSQLPKRNVQTIEATPINNREIAKLLKNYRDAPLGMQSDSDFRVSIAGAQEKTAFLKYNGKWHLPKTSTPTTHIVKLPIGKIEHWGIDLSNSVENEWLCLQILSHFNLSVNQAEIVKFGEMKVLICERFDRKWNEDHSKLLRLPQEDMCQLFGLSSAVKYESDGGPGIKKIMGFLDGAHDAEHDRMHFFKSCFAFWVLGAIDGHAKNFSIYIKKGGRFKLTPLYDVISAYPLAEKRQLEWKKIKMAMSVRGKNKHYGWNEILIRHWEAMAQASRLPSNVFSNIVEDVLDNMENVIDQVGEKLPKSFPLEIADSIFKGMRKVKNRI